MKTLTPLVFMLATLAAAPWMAKAADAEGCADLKLFPRLEGCVIVECSAKQHDSFDAGEEAAALALDIGDASLNSIGYSCPASIDPQRVKRELDAQLRKAGYLNVTENKTDPASPSAIARRGSHWLHWSANSEDGTTYYSLMSGESSTEKFKAETCSQPPAFSSLKQCEIVECTSKSEDSVALRTATKGETSLTGNIQTVTLSCPSVSVVQAFSRVESELKTSGFEILFSDREHPESGWLTGRVGKRWVELASAPDGESMSYVLTVISSAEVLTAATPEPKAAEHGASDPLPAPEPAPTPEPTLASTPPAAPVSPPVVRRATEPLTEPVSAKGGVFTPPKPIVEVPIEPTHDRIYSVVGVVVINILVDVDEDGAVTKAVLTGPISKDVLKLQSAALDAIAHWRFEPARQDGRIVASVKIPVQMRFRGRPWRF